MNAIPETSNLLQYDAILESHNDSAGQKDIQSLEKYKILFENARDIILLISAEGRVIEANNAAVKAYGYAREELISMKVQELRTAEEKHYAEMQLSKGHKHGFFYETIARRKDGSAFHIEVNAQSAVIQGESVLMCIVRDIDERKHMEKQLEYIARHDHLTNIPNRYYLEEYLGKVYKSSESKSNAYLLIDIDNFKAINDSYGHSAGDKVLVDAAECMKKQLRESDFIARIGGDEFAIFLPGANLDGARQVSGKLLNAIERKEFKINDFGTTLKVTASIGILMINDKMEMEHVFSYADAALYKAKQEGKNRFAVLQDSEDKIKVFQNNKMLSLIQEALKKDKFVLHFQPIFRSNNEILHFEALVRMRDEKGTEISPMSFIPLAEQYGLMPSIDKWVVARTLDILSRNGSIKVFVNLSGDSLTDENIVSWIESSIMESRIEPENIGFEITETAAIRNLTNSKNIIQRLKNLGCRFALDDFGVGFSSFSYLHMMPVDFLKIDGSFIRSLDTDTTSYMLVQAMNALAHALGKQTIAEFVETETIWDVLHDLGVDCGQGYYLGKPVPTEHIM